MVDSRQEGTLTGILDAAKTTTMLCPSNCRSRPIQENHGLTVVNLSATKRPQVTRERCGPRDTRRQRTADPGGGGRKTASSRSAHVTTLEHIGYSAVC
jgi:hypothetical protein